MEERVHNRIVQKRRGVVKQLYDPDVRVGLPSAGRRDRLGVALGYSGTRTRHLIV